MGTQGRAARRGKPAALKEPGSEVVGQSGWGEKEQKEGGREVDGMSPGDREPEGERETGAGGTEAQRTGAEGPAAGAPEQRGHRTRRRLRGPPCNPGVPARVGGSYGRLLCRGRGVRKKPELPRRGYKSKVQPGHTKDTAEPRAEDRPAWRRGGRWGWAPCSCFPSGEPQLQVSGARRSGGASRPGLTPPLPSAASLLRRLGEHVRRLRDSSSPGPSPGPAAAALPAEGWLQQALDPFNASDGRSFLQVRPGGRPLISWFCTFASAAFP